MARNINGSYRKYSTPSSREAVLRIITSYIGKPCPPNITIAEEAGLERGSLDNALWALYRSGQVKYTIKGNDRTLTVDGIGETLPGPMKTKNVGKWDDAEKFAAIDLPDWVRYEDDPAAVGEDAEPLPAYLLKRATPPKPEQFIPEKFRNARTLEW